MSGAACSCEASHWVHLAMKVDEIISTMGVVDLPESLRGEALSMLVGSVDWTQHGLTANTVIDAVEARESVAQTIVAEGLAMPHAAIDQLDKAVAVLGRSREGVAYGAAGDVVNLVLLLVMPRGYEADHILLLAEWARLLLPAEFRASLLSAVSGESARDLLAERSNRLHVADAGRNDEASVLSGALVNHALELAETCHLDVILLTMDANTIVPWRPLVQWKGKLLIATSGGAVALPFDRPDTHVFDLPSAALAGTDRVTVGLLLATVNGYVKRDDSVLCLTGMGTSQLDAMMIAHPTDRFGDILSDTFESPFGINPAVLMRIIALALEIASEGREGKPCGTVFVLGDADEVKPHTRQLVLNPFHGFDKEMRNVLDPSLAETVKEFAQLDGAIVVDNNGTLVSAGTYLLATTQCVELPGGLGTRHQAAAAITAATRSVSIALSQSTRKVTIFQSGRQVLCLERPSLTRW